MEDRNMGKHVKVALLLITVLGICHCSSTQDVINFPRNISNIKATLYIDVNPRHLYANDFERISTDYNSRDSIDTELGDQETYRVIKNNLKGSFKKFNMRAALLSEIKQQSGLIAKKMMLVINNDTLNMKIPDLELTDTYIADNFPSTHTKQEGDKMVFTMFGDKPSKRVVEDIITLHDLSTVQNSIKTPYLLQLYIKRWWAEGKVAKGTETYLMLSCSVALYNVSNNKVIWLKDVNRLWEYAGGLETLTDDKINATYRILAKKAIRYLFTDNAE
jgi:hypothetical protein